MKKISKYRDLEIEITNIEAGYKNRNIMGGLSNHMTKTSEFQYTLNTEAYRARNTYYVAIAVIRQ